MSGRPDIDLDADAEAAEAIVGAAKRRALGGRRGLRQTSAVLWASFLGATVSLVCVLLLPADGWLPLRTPARAALGFAALWLLAFIPALIATVLAAPPEQEGRDGPR